MRIIALTHLYYPHHFSGSEVGLHSILKFLQSKGHQVRVVHLDMRSSDHYSYDGIEVFGRFPFDSIQLQWADVVLSQLHFTGNNILDCNRAKRPCIHFLHNNDANYNQKLSHTVGRNYVVYNSTRNKETYKFDLPSIILHPPVSFQEYDNNSDEIFKKYHCKLPDKEYITLINLNKNKGVEIFYQIAKAMPEYKFLGVKGSYDEQIIDSILNVNIIESTNKMVEVVYSKTKLLLMPSEHESWGRTAVEAMCSGIPVVVSNQLKDTCSNAGIYIDNRNDVEEWVHAIKKVLTSNLKYNKYSRLSIDRARKLDSKNELEQLEEFIQQIVNREI